MLSPLSLPGQLQDRYLQIVVRKANTMMALCVALAPASLPSHKVAVFIAWKFYLCFRWPGEKSDVVKTMKYDYDREQPWSIKQWLLDDDVANFPLSTASQFQ